MPKNNKDHNGHWPIEKKKHQWGLEHFRQYLKSISNRKGKKMKRGYKNWKKMSTMWELTIDFKLFTGSDWVGNARITYPLDPHVEGVSPGHVFDGQCRVDYRSRGSREAVIDTTFSCRTSSNKFFANMPWQYTGTKTFCCLGSTAQGSWLTFSQWTTRWLDWWEKDRNICNCFIIDSHVYPNMREKWIYVRTYQACIEII